MDEDTASDGRAQVLAEDELKHMSRHIKNIVPTDTATADDINRLQTAFEEIYLTAATPNLGATHTVAAWNTWCALVDRIFSCDDQNVRDLLWRSAWDRASSLYLNQGHLARPKSSRQLLNTLTLALRKDFPRHEFQISKASAVTALVGRLNSSSDSAQVKACALALSNFLAKDLISVDTVLAGYRMQNDRLGSNHSLADLENFLVVLFDWMGKGDFGSTIGQLVSTLLDRAQLSPTVNGHETISKQSPIWAHPLRGAAKQHIIDAASLRVHLLPVLYKRNPSEFVEFLQDVGLSLLGNRIPPSNSSDYGREADDELLYASLQAGKDLGLIYETDAGNLAIDGGTVYLPIRWIGSLLKQSSHSGRLAGLSLLITSHSATRPFSVKTLSLIRRHLNHFVADTDTNFRSEVFSQVQKLVDRIRSITAVLNRHVAKPAASSDWSISLSSDEIMKYHRDFLEWLIRFLIWELRPTASYQRHISALKCLSIIGRSGLDARVPSQYLSKSALGETRWPFHLHIVAHQSYRLLLDLLVDPFDDVRQGTASILSLYPIVSEFQPAQLKLALCRAEEAMLSSGRADQADGVAHMYKLLDSQVSRQGDASVVLLGLVTKLEQTLGIAKVNIAQAVEKYPVHGLLISIRYVLGKSAELSPESTDVGRRLELCLHEVWDVVRPILCSNAPEGYLPESLEDTADVSTKDTLSYCWRALKEASLLLGTLISSKTVAGVAPDEERSINLSELCFTQLAELRHRGAFSTVAQTWVSCCLQCSSFSCEPGLSILQVWLDKVLSILRNKSTINTRRSAGLPSLLCGILIADRSGMLMRQAFRDLEIITREPIDSYFAQEGSLPQVHAMNCIKDMLKNSRLGEHTEQYVPVALRLAADALQSETWAVRNCGLMLFRAVIDRLLGTSDAYLEDDAHVQKHLSAEQHPQLLDIVLGLLGTSAQDPLDPLRRENEGVFPALQLLQRLAIPSERLIQARQSVKALMTSSAWHIRDKAARTYCSLVVQGQELPEIRSLLEMTVANQNGLHGALLGAKYIVRALGIRSANEHAYVASDLTALMNVSRLYYSNPCPMTRAAYIDLHIECLAFSGLYTVSEASDSFSQSQRSDSNESLNHRDICSQLQLLLSTDGDQDYAASNLLQRPLARALAAQLIIHDHSELQYNEIGTLIERLAELDTDSAIAFFREAHSLLERASATTSIAAVNILVDIAGSVLSRPSFHVRVMCAAQELLLMVTAKLRFLDVESQTFLKLAATQALRVDNFSSQGSQHNVDMSLRLRSACIDYCLRYQPSIPGLHDSLEDWVAVCCSAVTEDAFYSHEAVASSLDHAGSVWSVLATSGRLNMPFIRLCFAVYDLLNDDDEDIRLLTSHSVSRILATNGDCIGVDLTPLVASTELVTFMLKRWRTDKILITEAFSRGFNISDRFSPELAELIDAANQRETILFAEEKQNLYLDDSREVKVWFQVLRHVLATKIPESLKKRLSRWVHDGLLALTERSMVGADGALGWSTKPELFTLGFQLVYGAQLLLQWSEKGVRIPTRPSELRRQLGELAVASDAADINFLTRAEIDGILSNSISRHVQQVCALVYEVAKEARISAKSPH